MSKLLEEALPKIKDYLSPQPDILLAYLYGSYAEGRAFAWSDLDIGLLFAKDQPASKRFQQYRLNSSTSCSEIA